MKTRTHKTQHLTYQVDDKPDEAVVMTRKRGVETQTCQLCRVFFNILSVLETSENEVTVAGEVHGFCFSNLNDHFH